MSMRNRSAAKPKSADQPAFGGSNGSSKYEEKKGGLSLAIMGAISIAVLLGFSTMFAGDDSHSSSRTLRPHKKDKHHKSAKKEKKSSNIFTEMYEHKHGFGEGKKTTPAPEASKKTFWVESGKKINQPVSRALRMQGWHKTDDKESAQVIWTYVSTNSWYDQLKPWQRYNHIPNYKLWNQKDTFATYMLDYGAKSGKEIPAHPETYRLDISAEVEKFRKRLFEQGGLDTPWVLKKPNVNQGKGVFMLGPNSDELKTVIEDVEKEREEQRYIIQKYVCNEMTINNRKFDFRIFWIVASLDPLIMMYHDGYVRIGNAVYNEKDWSSNTAHLTTHTGLSEEGKGTWEEFEVYIREAAQKNKKLKKIKDPVLHVKNQVKQVLGEMAAAFKEATFNANFITAENGFGFYGGDFIIDWDLDVFFIEPQHGCGLDEDHQFRVDMHNSLFSEMIEATAEIWEKQEKGHSTSNEHLQNTGGYEVVYNDGWMFDYEGYSRAKDKKGCELAVKKE